MQHARWIEAIVKMKWQSHMHQAKPRTSKNAEICGWLLWGRVIEAFFMWEQIIFFKL